jgi:ribosomal protein S2
MLHQYYFNRLKLFKLPYRMLLAYHSPAGNPIKLWASYQMITHILGIRKDIHILLMTSTVIQIRKALNTVFKRINCRGTLLIYAQALHSLKMHHGAVFSFITAWVPGLLTNYKRVIKSLIVLSHHRRRLNGLLTRNQTYNISRTFLHSPYASKLTGRLKRRYPAIPSISCSISDSFVFLNENLCLGIPLVNLCDTQSPYLKVPLPIIANQKSVPFSNFIVGLFAEACSHALLLEHTNFLQLNSISNKRALSKHLGISRKKGYRLFTRQLFKAFFRTRRDRKVKRRPATIDELIQYHRYRRTLARRHLKKHNLKKHRSMIISNSAFIFNNTLFTYQIRDIVKHKSKYNLSYKFTLLNYIRNTFLSLILYYQKALNRYSLTKSRLRYYRFKKGYKSAFNALLTLLKRFYINNLGLSEALSRKRLEKARFLTGISFTGRDLSNLIMIGFKNNNLIFKLKLLQKFKLQMTEFIKEKSKSQRKNRKTSFNINNSALLCQLRQR